MKNIQAGNLSVSENIGKAVTLYAENFRVFLNFSLAVTAPTILQELLRQAPEGTTRFVGEVLRLLFLLPGMFFSIALVLLFLQGPPESLFHWRMSAGMSAAYSGGRWGRTLSLYLP